MDNSGPGDGSESWDAMKMLDSCIYYYLKKNNMNVTADIFAQEANLLHLPPDGDETLLTDWWSIFWDTYCATTRENSGPSSSLVQPNNMMGNAQQSIHGKAPVVIDQPVPLGADTDTMMMTGQQPAGHLLASNNYHGQQPAEALEQAQGQAQAQAQRLAEALQTLVEVQAEADAKAKAKANRQARSQAISKSKLQAGVSITNVSSQQLQALRVAAQSQQQVPPRGNRDGVSRGRSNAPGNEASTGANQQRSEEADVSKKLGRRSKKQSNRD